MQWRFWRKEPKPTIDRAIRPTLTAAVISAFTAQAEHDFGLAWRERLAYMTDAERDAWTARHFPTSRVTKSAKM